MASDRKFRRPWEGDSFRRAAPAVLLGLSLLVAGLGALEAVRAQRSHKATAEALLRDYGTFAAWSFAQRAAAELDGTVQATLGPPLTPLVTAGRPEACVLDLLERARQARTGCGCSGPVGGLWGFFVPYRTDDLRLTFVGEAPPAADQATIVERLRAHARAATPRTWPYALANLGEEADGTPILVAYQRIQERGDTVLYGVQVDAERMAARFDSVFLSPDLLPQSLARGQATGDLLAVTLEDRDGRPLFRSRAGDLPALHGEQPFPEALGGGMVRAAVLPEAAEQLIIGGLPRDRLPFLLLVFGLSGALALIAVSQFRKETQLARLRSDFVASVSHELRSPLAQVRLFVETLRLGRARSRAERDWALERIERETLRLTGLVENVLHFSRSERGLGALERQTAELAQEAAEAVRSIAPLLPAGRASLACEVPDGLACELHHDSFRQVLLNLIDNAVKYGPAGQTVRLLGERTPGHVRLIVEDEGSGVPPEDRLRIFEPFQRGEGAVGSVVAGSGIGLAVVRGIVRAHDGRVWVEEAAGGGARFVVELPAVRTARPGQLVGGPEASDAPREEVAAGVA